jgi:hypothetical protein
MGTPDGNTIFISNESDTPLTICLELDGVEFIAEPGSKYEIVTEGDPGSYNIYYSSSAITIISWLFGAMTYRRVE